MAAAAGHEAAHLDAAAGPDPALLHVPLAIGMEEKLGALRDNSKAWRFECGDGRRMGP